MTGVRKLIVFAWAAIVVAGYFGSKLAFGATSVIKAVVGSVLLFGAFVFGLLLVNTPPGV